MRFPELSAQPDIRVLGRYLLAALSVVAAAILAAPAPGHAGRSSLHNPAAADRALASGVKGLFEDGEPRRLDAASGDPSIKLAAPALYLAVALRPARTARPSLDVVGAPATHAVRAGLTRAPPLA